MCRCSKRSLGIIANGKLDCREGGGGGGGVVSRVEGQLCLVLLLWKLNFKLLELVTYSNFRSDLDQLKVAKCL